MENKEIEVGDFVVMIGCDKCNCENRGKIFNVTGLDSIRRFPYDYFCAQSEDSRCTEKLVYNRVLRFWFPISWLRTYPHFKIWHGK